ncbi:hypothetical protein [Nannocystis punicea]|uniref:4Fe-4S ferredoxin-type domain-containing protein n=1 Tax=Nannocystis punicea TaxID=2995304 RepID=A0ABY7H7M3_9BACT|nr:hypothetical protein [Nannocystis poenicansa]WAS95266.1 hypothetical protein O0S08_03825 [Nannocystis poenicansa]
MDTDIPACEDTGCWNERDPKCKACFAAATECPAATIDQCTKDKCFFGGVKSVFLAEDGTVVVECGVWEDTGCGP